MQNIQKTDTHTHSSFSFDGENTPGEMAEAAITEGISVLALTDHLDVNNYGSSDFYDDKLLPLAAEKIPPLKEEYQGRLNLLLGLELAQGAWDVTRTQKILNGLRADYDYIIGSSHAVRGYKDFYYINFASEEECYSLLTLYFKELIELAEWGEIDSIGHLTYPLRYISAKTDFKINAEKYLTDIKELFLRIIDKGIALEINTGGLRASGYGKTDPDYPFIKLYAELGGGLVTLGSDAHRTADIGKGLDIGISYALNAGIKKITYFKERKPHFINLTD